MSNFTHVIEQAYREILKRGSDPGGLAFYNAEMNKGLTESALRDAMMRSQEFKQNFPGEAAPPTPPPPPVQGGPMALTVQDGVFKNPKGETVKLLGAIGCCADADADSPGTLEYGWPLVTTDYLDLLAAHLMNLTHGRLGPMINKDVNPDGEPRLDVQAYALAPGGKQYDLNTWNDAYWTRLKGLVAYARDLGIYFQADLADTWVAEHGLTPWRAPHNIQGFDDGGLDALRKAPGLRHILWFRKIVKELGGFDNILWQDGNESFKGAGMEWVAAMRAIVRDEELTNGYPHRPFGTNTQDEAIERICDYGVWHEKQAPDPTTYPRMTNEHGDMSPAAVLEQIFIGWNSEGRVAFQYWRGGHNGKDFLATLAACKKIIQGTYIPPVIPDSCPPLVKWGSKIHNVMDGGFQQVPKPVLGGYVVVDSTPRFGSGRGEPCNDEHPGCGGRKCEDPRGGIWRLEAGSGPLHIQANGFQCRVRLDVAGHYTLRVSPRPDCQDASGKPVQVRGDASTVTEWDVS